MTFFNKKSTFVPYIKGRDITVVANYSALPDPTTVADKFYWCENSQGTAWLPGSLGGTYYPRGLYYSNGTTWEYMETPIQATQDEVDAGIIDDRFVSPNTLYNADQWNSVKVKLYTNGTLNNDPNKLNLVEGSNMTITDDGSGNITFDAAGGGGGSSLPHATASGTDTYTAKISGVTAYNDGDAYLIRFTNGNTDAATLNISGVGAVTLYRNNDGPLIGGDIWSGGEMLCTYNSTSGGFQCIGTSPNSLFAYVVNADSVAITRGQPVYAFGSTGNRMSVKLAYNTTDGTSAQTYGLVYTTSIAAGQKGIIIIQGVLDTLNLGGTWADGDPVYLGATAGTKTKTKPFAPNHLVYLGVVERANAGNGIMYVRVQNGFELDELHNVKINGETNDQVLSYDFSQNLWVNRTLTPDNYETTTDGAVTVSSTSNVYTSGILIPANSFAVGNNVEVTVRGRKTGTAGNMTMRIYANTTNNISGSPILIATNTTAAVNQTYLQFQRILSIKSTTASTEVFSNTGGSNIDYLGSNLGVNGLSINWTNDLYIVVSTQCTVAADSANARSSFIKIKR